VAEKSEELLVEAAQKGDLESFGVLYERYYGSMVALAYSVLAEKYLAEDAAQETFAVAWGNLHRLRRKDKFGPWLSGICRNVARQMRRKRKRAIPNIATPSEKGKNTGRIDKAVRQAVWKLKEPQREVILLRYFDQLSYERIAALLGISEQAVNGRLIRAKRKIAKHLKREGIGGLSHE
jgi:RNA polymerase sigma-70 factor (ECF subfamily)